MVTNVTSLTGNGLKDWLIQRFTAIYLAVYALLILMFFLTHPEPRYIQWQALFQPVWMKTASATALVAFLLHTWIGIWTVTTDYLKHTPIRLFIQFIVAVFLFWQLIWGLMIVWRL